MPFEFSLRETNSKETYCMKVQYGYIGKMHAFNLREGFKPSDFTMPPRIEGKPAFKAGSLKDVTLDLEGLKKQYYEAMKFDYTTGKIQKERIAELGLEHILS